MWMTTEVLIRLPLKYSLGETRCPKDPLDQEPNQAFWTTSCLQCPKQATEIHLLTSVPGDWPRDCPIPRALGRGLRSLAMILFMLNVYRKEKFEWEGCYP